MSAIKRSISNYLSLVKFSHTIFAMPFALIGFLLAAMHDHYGFHWSLFVLVVLCMVFARSAAMAFNRYLDRNIDKKNPRTAMREIPAGVVSANSALWFVILSSFLFICSAGMINHLCLILSPVALLVILGYSYTKRFTALCHVVLGIGLSLAPIGAYVAVSGVFSLLPLFFSACVVFWVSGFDIIYALQDREFDNQEKLHSLPVWMGIKNALRLSEIFHTFSALLIITAGFYGHFSFLYWSGASVFIGLLAYQHTIIKPTDLSRVNLAFATTNGIASVIFGVFVAIELLLQF